MGAYQPLPPTGLDKDLVPVEVRKEFFRETLLNTNLTPYMGRDPMSAIQVDYKKMGTGSTLNVPFLDEIDYKNPIKGNFAQVSGKGQNIQFYSDTVTVGFQALSVKLPGIQFMEIDTPIPMMPQMRPLVERAQQQNIVYELLKSATLDLYTDSSGALVGGPVADRVLYAAPAANPIYQNTIAAALNAMAANTSAYNSSGLSVAGIRKMRDLAILGGTSYRHERRISPIALSTMRGGWVPTYVYLMGTTSYRSLNQDPDWKNYYTRGTIESSINQPSGLRGAFYKGLIDNIEVYECPELEEFTQESGNSKFGWNLFMGAQAFYLLWGDKPWFKQEYSNMGLQVELAIMEIRGQKALQYPSKNNPQVLVENGLIHSFVNITGL